MRKTTTTGKNRSRALLALVAVLALAVPGISAAASSAQRVIQVSPSGTISDAIEAAQPGDIIDTNSIVLASQIRLWGGEPRRYPITADELMAIRARVLQAAGDCDLILLNAGSSAGSEDFSAQVIANLGDLLVHGVAVRPGHPAHGCRRRFRTR